MKFNVALLKTIELTIFQYKIKWINLILGAPFFCHIYFNFLSFRTEFDHVRGHDFSGLQSMVNVSTRPKLRASKIKYHTLLKPLTHRHRHRWRGLHITTSIFLFPNPNKIIIAPTSLIRCIEFKGPYSPLNWDEKKLF